jgi:hypothetical protein
LFLSVAHLRIDRSITRVCGRSGCPRKQNSSLELVIDTVAERHRLKTWLKKHSRVFRNDAGRHQFAYSDHDRRQTSDRLLCALPSRRSELRDCSAFI